MPYIPDSVFKSGVWQEMSHVEAKVYVTLCQHYNRKERRAFPSVSRIAGICGCSARQVFRVMKGLEQKGLVIKRKKENPYGKDFNYYMLPDFLLYELELKAKEPAKYGSDIMSLATDIMSLIGDMGNRNLETPSHPNYIINHINIINSFNNPSGKKPKETNNTNRLPEIEERQEPWANPEEHAMMIEQYVKPLMAKFGPSARK